MKQRTITGLLILAIFVPLIIIEELFSLFQVAMIVLVIIAAIELIKMYEKEKKFSWPVKLVIVLSTLLIYFAALTEWSPRTIPAQTLKLFNISLELLPTTIIVLIALFCCTIFSKEFNGADVGKSLMVVFYSAIGFSSITILKYLGTRYIVYLFLVTILTDVFAYFTGVLFGKHKMCPTISPKKTWEGAIGGTIVASVVAICFAIFYGPIFGDFFGPEKRTILDGIINIDKLGIPWVVVILVFMTIIASVVSQIGDLVASRLKRTYDIKDFGSCFPGHGGVLDRFDSAILCSMFIISIIKILNYLLPVMGNSNILG